MKRPLPGPLLTPYTAASHGSLWSCPVSANPESSHWMCDKLRVTHFPLPAGSRSVVAHAPTREGEGGRAASDAIMHINPPLTLTAEVGGFGEPENLECRSEGTSRDRGKPAERNLLCGLRNTSRRAEPSHPISCQQKREGDQMSVHHSLPSPL